MSNVASHDEERQLVVFELASEIYGIDIKTVREIIRMQKITYVPDAPAYVEGMINLRGRVIPVVDLRRRFGLMVANPSPEMRILVVDIAGEDIGVIVDAVTEVKRIAGSSVQRDALIATADQAYYLEGIAKLGDQLLILLDLERALVQVSGSSAGNPAAVVADAA